MTTFRVTEQDARTIERSYDIEASNADEAFEIFESLIGDEKAPLLVHTETLNTNCEVVSVEETS